jgi:hypothetical protein
MSRKNVPVRPTLVAVSGRSVTPADEAAEANRAAAAGVEQISMQDLENLKARSRELMALIVAAQHRS